MSSRGSDKGPGGKGEADVGGEKSSPRAGSPRGMIPRRAISTSLLRLVAPATTFTSLVRRPPPVVAASLTPGLRGMATKRPAEGSPEGPVIGTHSGSFHCDEALGVFLLRRGKGPHMAGPFARPALSDVCLRPPRRVPPAHRPSYPELAPYPRPPTYPPAPGKPPPSATPASSAAAIPPRSRRATPSSTWEGFTTPPRDATTTTNAASTRR